MTDTLGQQAADVALVAPVGQTLGEAIVFVDTNNDPIDVSGDTWQAVIFDPNDPLFDAINLTIGVAGNTITVTAAAAALDAGIGTRQRLRWRLTNTTTGYDILTGQLDRDARGIGRRTATGAGTTVQYATNAVTVIGPASTVVSGGTYAIDGGTADTPAGAYARTIDGGSA